MKKIKNSILLGVIIAAAFLMTGCFGGVMTTNVTILKDGNGTKTFNLQIWKNNTLVPEGHEGDDGILFTPDNNFENEEKGEEEWAVLLEGQDLADAIAAHSPVDFAKVSITEDDEYYYLKISFDFTDINDYNAKSKQLAGTENAAKFIDATLTKSGNNYTFTEATSNSYYTINRWVVAVVSDTDICKMDGFFSGSKHMSAAGSLDDYGEIVGGSKGEFTGSFVVLTTVGATIGNNKTSVEIIKLTDPNALPEIPTEYSVTGNPSGKSGGCPKAAESIGTIAIALGAYLLIKKAV